MVRSRFAAQMELLNTELIVMGTLCENALEHVMQALQELSLIHISEPTRPY